MLPTKEIEEKVRECMERPLSNVHAFDHLHRTAVGAKWFAGILGGSREDEEKAYVASLVHDLHRPPSEEGHEESLPINYAKAREVLEGFDLEESLVEELALPAKEHRGLMLEGSIACRSTFLADKILEDMGAVVVFRRNIYFGETTDYKGVSLREATIRQYERRLEKHKPKEFPERFARLAESRYKWPVEFFEAYKKQEEWAVHLSEYCYKKGVERGDFEAAVTEFEPESEEGAKYKEEAVQYIQGKKFKQFEEMIG